MSSLLGCQEWPWTVYWRGRGVEPEAELERSMAWTRAAGLAAWEGSLPMDDAALKARRRALTQSGLQAPSFYVNARLHEGDPAQSTATVLRRCEAALGTGFKVLVLNPEPIAWGQAHEKSDGQLHVQAAAILLLQQELGARGVALAYHIHDSEMRSGARELWTTLQRVPGLKLCLECEWQVRGGWDDAAVQGFVQQHADRFVLAHLRQAKARAPQLALGPGDIDYAAVAARLRAAGFAGPAIFEGYQEGPVDEATLRQALADGMRWMGAHFA